MNLVHVIPIARGIARDRLSYFTSKNVVKGSLVSVPLRNKVVPAIVIQVEDLRFARSQLRKAKYAVKKIVVLKNRSVLSDAYLKAAESTAIYTASSVGAVFYALIPKVFLDNIDAMPALKNPRLKKGTRTTYIIEAPRLERVAQYAKQIKLELKLNKSVYICVSTREEAQRIGCELAFLNERIFVFHGFIPRKELVSRMEAMLQEKRAVVIVGTGNFLALPRTDIGTIIIERESSGAYKKRSRPFVDIRVFATYLSKYSGARLIIGDDALRIETMYGLTYDQKVKRRSNMPSQFPKKKVVDMRKYKGKTFKVLSLELEKLLMEASGHVFLFTATRGVSSNTICEDCGEVVLCQNCEAPAVLHKGTPENIFVCHNCGESRSAKERCRTCNSWKLKPIGVGIERVVDEVKKNVGDVSVFVISSDHTKTHSRIKKEMKSFMESEGGILIGTEMALNYLEERVDFVAVVSIDALLSVPDPKIFERVYTLLLALISNAKKTFLLQTRQPELSLIQQALDGYTKQFYKDELEERKRFGYPPFTVLIKVSVSGTRLWVAAKMEEIKKQLEDYDFRIYPAFGRTKRDYVLNALIRVSKKSWPNTKLIELLRSLPPNVMIDVEPESVL
ncbi:hypothetical protein IIB51_02530 [Patescibacteria group bacterium]|nr:hypothetical protein [Patescibacteria group bacterium]